MKSIKYSRIVLSCLAVLGIIIFSCSEDEPPIGYVTVTKMQGNTEVRVAGAIVSIVAGTGERIYALDGTVYSDKWTKITDGSGTCQFDFKYPNIVDVDAKYGIKKNDTIRGTGKLVCKDWNEPDTENILMEY